MAPEAAQTASETTIMLRIPFMLPIFIPMMY
jgi:hypothetical protein